LGTDRYSYTKYDALGRITEVGEKVNTVNNPRNSNFLSTSLVNAFLNTGQSAQITRTIYDQALFPYQNPGTARKRVSATTYQDTEGETYPDASYYSYDIMGNVKTLIQRSKMLVAADNSNGEKRIDYQYDLISGKVNQVIYQPGKGDQFIHRYDYDADNRIISVNTSRDGLIWQNDAKYVYHLHGPLARTELGDQKVQGMDYAYTLQGWLKGVNSSSLHEGLFDIGQDGKTGGSLPIVAMDAFGYSLDFYVGDYKPIGQQAFSLNTFTSPSPTPATGFKSLYNGNIGAMVTNIRQLNTPQYTYYHYDQLNRIKRMEALHGQNAAANTWTFGLRFNGYIEAFTYDPNGNIMTLSRNSNVEQIDDLTYNYLAGTNKLTGVTDPIASGLVNYDIDGQAANNYSYDRIGNMTADNAEGITNISWTVYGKIKNITKSTGTIEYRYDASGNRIYKKTFISGATTETYYARDAQGNVMAVYEKQAANPLKWIEQHLYGSSRLGMWNLADVVPGTNVPASGGTVEDGYLYGSKLFELSNHLGNVLVTVSDKKIGIDDGGNGTTDYFQPEVLTAQDYYSFGMAMPGRKYTKPNSGYRYGFNGKENDNDVKDEGNQQDYGMRIYDPRLAKFLSVDPISRRYPMLTPYQFASNRPIDGIDLDGLEWKAVMGASGNVVEYEWVGGGTFRESKVKGVPRQTMTYPAGTVTNAAIQNANVVTLYAFNVDNAGQMQPKITHVSKDLPAQVILDRAKELGVEMEVLNAVRNVESPRGPFDSENQASILFERHYMYSLLEKVGYDAKGFNQSENYRSVVNSESGGYGLYSEQVGKLELASQIDKNLAIMSASWGSFQVMGIHYALAYRTPEEMATAMNFSQEEQFNYFISYIKNTPGLVTAMRNKDWREVARLYNGPKYEKNSYHTKMQKEYEAQINAKAKKDD
jgi:RHS repeat-associated protein